MIPERSFDVVIIGAGFAGLAAAVRSAEMGLRTIVLEKGATNEYLCSSRISGGVFHVAHEDVTKPAAAVLAAIRQSTGGKGDADLAEALANSVGPTMAWLQGLGASFIRSGETANHTLMAAPPRPLAEPLDWMTTWRGRGPDVLVRLLAQKLQKFGGEFVLGTWAKSLVMENGKCVGVDTVIENRAIRYCAHSVVIADGGFQNDPDLVRAHIAPRPEGLCRRNAGTAAGDGLRMAQAAGADTTSLKGFYGHVLSRDAMQNPLLWPYPLLDELCVHGLIVDGQGHRFCDEGRGGVFIANAIAARENPVDTVAICDSAIWHQSSLRQHVSVPNPKLVRLGGTIYSAGTISELAKSAGLPPAELEATVSAHNQAINGGSEANPPRTPDKAKPIADPPFYAIPACAGITFTMGGIRINANAQVLDTLGTPIPGLYAAGSATGGLDVGDQAIYVSGLSKALVFGKLAADHILSDRGQPAKLEQAVEPEKNIAAKYPSLALVARHGRPISAIIALVPTLVGCVVAAQLNGSLQIIAVLISIVLGGITYLAIKVLIELIRLIMETLLPSTLD